MVIVDLSMAIQDHWRWRVQTELALDHKRGDSWQSTNLALSVHAFTHIDTPLHLDPDGETIEEAPLEKLCGPAAVLDLSYVSAHQAIGKDDLRKAGGHIVAGDIVILKTDWDQKRNWKSKEFWMEAPYVEEEAASWLANQEIKAVGFDFPQDHALREIPSRHPPSEELPTHNLILRKGIYLLEYLSNLCQVRTKRVKVFAFPLKLQGAEAAPARVAALIEG